MRLGGWSLFCAAVGATGCATGYQPRPIAERQVLEDLRAVRVDALAPCPPSCSAASPVGFDASDGLSQDEAVAVGLCVNPGLRAFRAERGVAEGELVAAGVLPNPELEVQWLHIEGFTQSLATGGIGLGLSWQPPRPGERQAKQAGALARIGQVREEIAREEWRVATEVRGAFVGLAGVDERLRLAGLALEAQRRVRDFVGEQQAGGLATRLDASLAEIEYVSALREREALVTERERARQALNRALGLPPEADVALQGTAAALAYRPADLDPRRLEDTMLERRPELRAARLEYERAEQDLHLAWIQRIPWVRFGPAYERDGSRGEGSVDKIGVGLGLELPIANRNEGEIARLSAARDRLQEEFRAKVHEGRAEVHEALQAMRAQERLVRLFEGSIEPALRAGDRLLQAGLEAKEVDLLRYLTTQERAIEARRAHVESLERYWQSVYALERAIGARVVTSPPPSPSATPSSPASR